MTVDQTDLSQFRVIPNSDVKIGDRLILTRPDQTDHTSGRDMSAILPAASDFFAALNRAGLRYCHWKSNVRLEEALSGLTDLDILVDPVNRQAFRSIVRQFDIKRTLAAPGRHYPALENYIGFDPSRGRLFHLHVHYQLVLGEQFVKNYHLPLEALFFDSVQLDHGLKVPSPELELIVLSLRALLKYRDRDVIKDILTIRSPGLPAPILKEIRYLLARTTQEELSKTLTEISDSRPSKPSGISLDSSAV